MPRPRVSEPKSATIIFRVTAEDKKALEEKAHERADVDTINFLRECADELNAMHAALRGSPSGETQRSAARPD
jgi:hypothetical protein